MKLRLRVPLVTLLLGAVAWGAGCLNPRPEDFPSRTDLEDDRGEPAGGSNDGHDPRDQTGRPGLDGPPDTNEPEAPGNSDPDPVEEPEPSPGADAGIPAEADAGSRDGGPTADAD